VCYSIDKKTREVSDYPPRLKISIDRSLRTVFVKYPGSKKFEPVAVTPETIGNVIEKGDYVRPVVEHKNIWMSTMGFGTKWKLVSARVYKSDICSDDIAGGSDDEDDDDSEVGADTDVRAVDKQSIANNNDETI
jgi:hypothetical protein